MVKVGVADTVGDAVPDEVCDRDGKGSPWVLLPIGELVNGRVGLLVTIFDLFLFFAIFFKLLILVALKRQEGFIGA